MTGNWIARACGAVALVALVGLAAAGCAATSSGTGAAAAPDTAVVSATAAVVSPASASPPANSSVAATAAPATSTAVASTAVATPAASSTSSSACAAFAASHTFLHLTRAAKNADGTLTVTGNTATMVCGGPDDFRYDLGSATVTGRVLASATIQVLNSTLQDTPITIAQFPGYLASDQNVRVFTYAGPRSAITALSEQFHP